METEIELVVRTVADFIDDRCEDYQEKPPKTRYLGKLTNSSENPDSSKPKNYRDEASNIKENK